MQLFQTLAAGAVMTVGLCLLRSEYEKNHFVTETYTVHSPKIAGDGKTFVFLSDLHNKEFGEENRKLVDAVRAVNPDAILVGGDMMICKGKQDVSVALELMKQLADICPVYYGNGNHESRMKRETEVYGDQYREYAGALRAMGITYLSDASAEFGEDFVIYGLDLPEELYLPGYPQMRHGLVYDKLGKAAEEKTVILLAHSPMFLDEYADWGADLVLSGHFHGGTIRLPILGGVMTPQYQFFYPRCAGEFEKNGKKMIVSRGLGTHSINVRLGDKPQVVVVEMVK